MTYAPASRHRVRDRARTSLQDITDLEATDSAAIAYPGTSGDLVRRREPSDVAAARRNRRFQELVAAVAHGPGVLPPRVRESLVGAPHPRG
jgi:putative intracellular protease/amidase